MPPGWRPIESVAVREAAIVVSLSDLALVKARLTGTAGVRISKESFSEVGATITAELPEANVQPIVWMLTDMTRGRA
ncbi:DUF1949 domain-containing protein [Microvirga vignae]|uniref:DUF1949 domain-containing protein n=1 Tax=Microvirga vignae TaxID=1225564 RepID=UPI00069A995A|nr:DUF1949 domain-containing protein [Microvirga vignae]